MPPVATNAPTGARPAHAATGTTGEPTRTRPDEETASTARHRRLRTAVPGVVLLAAYYLLSLLNSPDGFLGTDTGGKVATLKAMAAHHTFTNVDVGYWAVRWDPHGLLHPLYNTLHIGDHWVQVTTLPMLLAGAPLYRLGGYRLALLLPMLGAVGCAYAARALAARFGGDRTRQWWAFWIVGLASPVAIYALDFWEHTIGLALMAFGLVALLDLMSAEKPRRRILLAAGAGLAFGSAATMRTEALVYLAACAAVVGVWLLVRDRKLTPWILPTAALGAATAVPLLANRLLSQWVLGGGLRESRAGGAVTGSGSHLALRLREGLVTTFGISSATSDRAILTGILFAVVIAVCVLGARPGSWRPSRAILLGLLACAAVLYLTTFTSGLDWVSGITGAAPLAAAGAMLAWRSPKRRVAALAVLLALPVVWAFQWTGGAGPQWGGRYVLTTMFVLVVIGVVSLPKLRLPVGAALVVLSVAVTVFGLAWVSVRTHDVAHTMRVLDARPEAVLVADGALAHLPREGGAFYGDHRWLATDDPAQRSAVVELVKRAGFDSFALVDLAPATLPPSIDGFTAGPPTTVMLFSGTPLTVTPYHADPSRG